MIRPDFNKTVHFIGIGGISMSSLAMILISRGVKVSGSDSKESELTASLRQKGAVINIGQSKDNITADIGMVVYTAAIAKDNPELKRAMELGISCVSRAEFLGQLMKDYKNAVCVSGTHGKTTTTSLISQILLDADADPTILVGGMLPIIGGNTRIGRSDCFLTEACEYTNSFLSFFPTTAVILNVKADHLDFFKDLDDIRSSFRTFAGLLPEDGTLIINGEIDRLDYFTADLNCDIITFGLKEGLDFTAADISFNDLAGAGFNVIHDNEYIGHVQLLIPGMHNVYNALAAIAAAYSLGIDMDTALKAVGRFEGVDRRFQIKGSLGGVTVIDDYAHHPDEIAATLSAAADFPHKKLWLVFQPHTYSRTKALLDEFAAELSKADAVILADIYAARETDNLGISSLDLKDKISSLGTECYYFPTFDEIENFLLENCAPKDMFITMGAGDVVKIGDFLLGR